MPGTFKALKSALLGKALGDSAQESERYSIKWGLPILSSDAISSVAYACEEILLVFVPVLGLLSFSPMFGVVGVIIALLFILILCYRQTIDIYPEGGGAYSVARDNFGPISSLVSGSALIFGYVLTVAVSAASGAAAIVSAFPDLAPFKVAVTIVFIILLMLGNLRGIREASIIFGLPTYFFIVAILVMIITGVGKAFFLGTPVDIEVTFAQPAKDLTLFLFLRAFSSGCSALTGVEAISNSVPNFKEPSQKNAKKTMVLLGGIVFVIFGGVCLLAALYQVIPLSNITVVAQIAQAVFGSGSAMFYVVQIATALILLLAANTAYNGLPQLMSLMAAHHYLPHRFADKGTRLVFSNGIIFATAASILLVIFFEADTHRLIPLYAVGVFISFTVAQAGMFKHWITKKTGNWRHKAIINGSGAIITGIVCIVIGSMKFTQGAWMALLAIAVLTFLMMRIKKHYDRVKDDLTLSIIDARNLVFKRIPGNHVIVPLQTINRSFVKALNYALGLGGTLEVYHVSTNSAVTEKLKQEYRDLRLDLPLVIDETSYRNVNEVLLKHVDDYAANLQDHQTLTIVMPQLMVRKWWHYTLHNQTSIFLETALLGRKDIAVVMIPYLID
ncbi:MAG: APC family permease [Coriobacteriaceae bacterium]|nr:APC family permease [Coriobacteriaceae bacterium]